MLPSLLNALSAIHRLRQCQRILDSNQAVDYLENRFNSYRLLALYQHLFPVEFKHSTAAPYPEDLNNPDSHSSLEIEFLYLVNQNLFPISEFQIENAYEERLHQIPLMPMGCDWIGHEDIESLRFGWQILLPLSTEGRYWLESVEGTDWYEYELGVSWEAIAHPKDIDAQLFKKLSYCAAKPLEFMPLALQLLDYESNNIWLDSCATNEPEISLPWTLENIKFLQSEWLDAKVILDQVYHLIEWLEQDLINHLELILGIWNTSSLLK
ncbi:hypothetical protein [Iningainema tapete]|uniref:Uncharacterized protein n=1 Tax=Iningainema tapete BLCC-T55 TaxID=2748662 RepID=A0A8J6XHA3_9CYAN|nr:hypothetical protein [Iningainema tapete]MBD2772557.1 hypothetical protein [Iningainema tapete BLCC-T55]